MDIFMNIASTTLREGLMYGILALGVYITYSILDFPDLSVDGTMPLGAIVTTVLILQGMNPWLALVCSFAAGALAGTVTGLLHVKLKIRPLLCGILVYTALISVNLAILMGGSGGLSLVTYMNDATIFTSGLASVIPETVKNSVILRQLLICAIMAILCKLALDFYLKTKSGLLLRATGCNPKYVTQLGKNPGTSKILGLALGNGFAALAGSMISQAKTTADTQMGVGMVVLGLASVIIGLSLFGRIRIMKPTTMVLLGCLIFKACLTFVQVFEFPLPGGGTFTVNTIWLKAVMAILLTLALLIGDKNKKKRSGKKKGDRVSGPDSNTTGEEKD